jgi:hypothetical protein
MNYNCNHQQIFTEYPFWINVLINVILPVNKYTFGKHFVTWNINEREDLIMDGYPLNPLRYSQIQHLWRYLKYFLSSLCQSWGPLKIFVVRGKTHNTRNIICKQCEVLTKFIDVPWQPSTSGGVHSLREKNEPLCSLKNWCKTSTVANSNFLPPPKKCVSRRLKRSAC